MSDFSRKSPITTERVVGDIPIDDELRTWETTPDAERVSGMLLPRG